jgi:ADP-ribose pyrophosphatase YjhB (NUDIX family)
MSRRVHLATGLLERDGSLLLVASRYPNQPEPLWNLPGGRQRDGELLSDAVRREFLEETGLVVRVGSARYVSESYDRATNVHFLNVTFDVSVDNSLDGGDAGALRQAQGDNRQAQGDNRQAQGDNRQAQGDNRQAQGDNRQAQGDNRQAQGDNRQAQGDNRQAQGDNRQAQGDNRQAQGDNRQARGDSRQAQGGDAHVTGLAWVPRAELAGRLTVAVVREPLLAHLGDERLRYFGFADAGITIEFSDPP